MAAPAATEVLPGATAAVPQPLPASAELPAPVSPVATAPPATRRGWLAASAAGLLLIAGGSGYFFINRANASATALAAVAAPPVAESTLAAAAPVPTPAVDQPVVIPADLPTPKTTGKTTAAHAKPAASVKANSAAPPMPTPSVYATAKSAAPEPAPERAEAPDRNLSLIEQGNRLAGAGQLPDAIQAYEKARRANPGNADVYYLLGSAYQRSGELAKALEAYRQCTSGTYAAVAAHHVKNLEKKLGRTNKGQAPAPE